jgi:hypothetical protein
VAAMSALHVLSRAAPILLALAFSAACRREEARALLPDPLAPSGTSSGLAILDANEKRPNFWDFGDVTYGTQLRHTFRLENRESEAVTVQDLVSSCGCTVPSISYKTADGQLVSGRVAGDGPVIVLPPKSVAEMRVEIDTSHVELMNADKLAQVSLRCNAKHSPYMRFELHLLVERIFRSVPAVAEFGEVAQGYGKDLRCDLSTELAHCPARVLGIERVEGPFTATVDATQIQGQDCWILLVSAAPGSRLGPQSGSVVLKTTKMDGSGEGPPFSVSIRAQIVPDVVLRPAILHFAGKNSIEAVLDALGPGHKLRIVKSELSGDAASALEEQHEAISPDKEGRAAQWKIVLNAKSTLPREGCKGQLVLSFDDPKFPELLVPWSAAAR